MKILVLSCDDISWALKLQSQGHDVGLWHKDKTTQRVGLGLVRKFVKQVDGELVSDFDAALAWRPDFVICDVNNLTYWAELARKAGFRVYSGHKLNDALESDRFGALKWAQQNDVRIPTTIGFEENETNKAIRFLIDNPSKKWIIKSSRKDKASSFMANRPEDIEPFMEQYPPNGPFILQEQIKGIEINHEIWFSQGRPVLYMGGMEQKKFMPGDKAHPNGLGSNTGCTSNLSWPIENYDLCKSLFTPKLMQCLAQLKYEGPLDMACIIGEEDKLPYFIEFTPRFGYYSICDEWELIDTDWAAFLKDLTLGRMPKYKCKLGFSFSVEVSLRPYPYEVGHMYIKGQNVRISSQMRQHYWPNDVMLEKGNLVTAGTSGALGCITAYAKTPEDGIKLAMQRAQSFDMSDVQYRSDSGMRQIDNINKLRKWGFKIP